jgi:hypothetical protein
MHSLKGLPPAMVALVVCCGCAAQTAARPTCAPVPDEFSLVGQTVYRDCGVDRKARPPGIAPRLNYTPSAVATAIVGHASRLPLRDGHWSGTVTEKSVLRAAESSRVIVARNGGAIVGRR